MSRWFTAALFFAAGLALLPADTAAAPKPDAVKAVVDKAVAFLKTKQNEDGSFAPKLGGPGITALTVAGLLRNGYGADNAVVANGLKYLEGNVQPDGGVYSKGLANYTTCLAIVAFKEANAGGKYDKVIANAAKFVKGLQYGDGTDPKDVKFGGVGYDKPAKGRPDLSNTHFMVEALLAAGVPQGRPGDQAGAGVHQPQPEPAGRVQRPAVRGARRATTTRAGSCTTRRTQDNDKSDKRDGRRRPAQRGRHDLRRAQELPVRRAWARTTRG